MITVYKKSTGEITKVCNCLESDIPLQYNNLIEAYIEGDYEHNNYYIQDSQAIEIPAAPNAYSIFNYTTKQWEDPRTNTTQWELVKRERNQRLLECDWTQLPDVPLSTKNNWAIYRQALRDITAQEDPFNIVWPVSPP